LLETILHAIAVQKQRGCLERRTTADGRSTIPHQATWLNGRRWEDENSTPADAGGRSSSVADIQKGGLL